ncbi:tetratricopeptide repeat protein [Thalassotalea aquiviva]|uniref:tetratricopeptide repeat protein n=1 Tax=Thalassotalea aquiviva TaxID=3242415 RepID=UPI003529E341
MSQNIVELTPENFQQVVLEESQNTAVIVAFWAEQIPESVEVKNLFVQKVMPHGEHMILATVDCQVQQAIAQQFGIQALPTVVLVQNGQPTDGLSGPQTAETIEQFLAKHLPKEDDLLLLQGKQLLEQGNANDAFEPLTKAHQLAPERADIKLALTDVYLQSGKVLEAESLLASIKMIDQDSDYQAMMAKLELAQEASNSPEIQALEQQLQQSPDNVELIRKLAVQYNHVNRYQEAASLLYALLLKDRNDGESKKLLLDIMAVLPNGDPLVSQYRRKLFSLMY